MGGIGEPSAWEWIIPSMVEFCPGVLVKEASYDCKPANSAHVLLLQPKRNEGKD